MNAATSKFKVSAFSWVNYLLLYIITDTLITHCCLLEFLCRPVPGHLPLISALQKTFNLRWNTWAAVKLLSERIVFKIVNKSTTDLVFRNTADLILKLPRGRTSPYPCKISVQNKSRKCLHSLLITRPIALLRLWQNWNCASTLIISFEPGLKLGNARGKLGNVCLSDVCSNTVA